MLFKSTRSESVVSFKEAILKGCPLDGGLFVPASVPDLRQFFLYMDSVTSYTELVSAISPSFLKGDINPIAAARVVESAFDFEPEVQQLDEKFSILKLYNGPTGVFKDFGIAYLAAVIEELNNGKAIVLTAARHDTGVSIAHAFHKRKNITAVILYPSGPIRGLDESAFVQNGGNIVPIQIKGCFDDCQRIISSAMLDRDFAERYSITSANAVNIGRLLPQAFYYLYAFVKLKGNITDDLVFSVPCGNFANLIAGLYAWKFGLPVHGFIAAMNANNSFGGFFSGQSFNPAPAPIVTNSPAMDVCYPSNYERVFSFYQESPAVMKNMVFPEVIDDATTIKTIRSAWEKFGILLNPHSAVAFAAAERAFTEKDSGSHCVVLATGHPAKTADFVSRITGQNINIPQKLAMLKNMSTPAALIPPELDAFESAIAAVAG
ncbi:MAG: threonine synthase [Treponema sp.]|jgi:threonine synthase|nr:threonine synthase [Treponema sp.]